jgi:hypothetical protein
MNPDPEEEQGRRIGLRGKIVGNVDMEIFKERVRKLKKSNKKKSCDRHGHSLFPYNGMDSSHHLLSVKVPYHRYLQNNPPASKSQNKGYNVGYVTVIGNGMVSKENVGCIAFF